MLESLWSAGTTPGRKGRPGLQVREAPSRLETTPAPASQPGEILPSEVAGERGAVAGEEAEPALLPPACCTAAAGKPGMLLLAMVTREAGSPGSDRGEAADEGAVR